MESFADRCSKEMKCRQLQIQDSRIRRRLFRLNTSAKISLYIQRDLGVWMNLEQEESHSTLFSRAFWGLIGELDLSLSLR